MAVVTEPISPLDYVPGFKKAAESTRLVKTDIIRHGVSGWTGTIQKTRIPHNPRTPPQVGVRCLVEFIMSQWWTFTETEKEQWADAKIWYGQTYLGVLVDRWTNLDPPSREPNPYHTSEPIAIASHDYTGGNGCATLSITPADAASIYGVVLFRSPSEIIDPVYTQAIVMIPAKTTDPISFCDSPLAPGVYHYRAAVFNVDGVLGPVLADDFVTVF